MWGSLDSYQGGNEKAVLVGKARVRYDKGSCCAPVFSSFILHCFLFSFLLPCPLLPMTLISSGLCYQLHSHQGVIIGLGVSLLCTTYTHTNLRIVCSPTHLFLFCSLVHLSFLHALIKVFFLITFEYFYNVATWMFSSCISIISTVY